MYSNKDLSGYILFSVLSKLIQVNVTGSKPNHFSLVCEYFGSFDLVIFQNYNEFFFIWLDWL